MFIAMHTDDLDWLDARDLIQLPNGLQMKVLPA